MAMTLATGALGKWNIDASRHARELLEPEDYRKFSYYEKWVSALTDILVQTGLLDEVDLKNVIASDTQPVPLNEKALRPQNVLAAMGAHVPYTREVGPTALFAIGDYVRTASQNTNRFVKGGHSRLPEYAMDCVGRIVDLHGTHVLPDSNAHFKGENPEPLYGVEFTAETLWGVTAEGVGDTIVLDLWQSYLEAEGE